MCALKAGRIYANMWAIHVKEVASKRNVNYAQLMRNDEHSVNF